MNTGQQLGVAMANNFMLTLIFDLIADMSEDPDRFRTDIKNSLCELADDHNLPAVAPDVAREARDAAKQIFAAVLQNSILNRQ